MGMDSVENGDHIGGLLPWKVSRPSHRLGNPVLGTYMERQVGLW